MSWGHRFSFDVTAKTYGVGSLYIIFALPLSVSLKFLLLLLLLSLLLLLLLL